MALAVQLALVALVMLVGCETSVSCDDVLVRSEGGEDTLRVCVDRARTADERRVGLTGYAALAADAGLLLVFPLTGEVCISQAFVAFPIDVLFIDEEQKVVQVAANVAAGSEDLICVDRVRYVLEVAATAARNVSVGDRAVFVP